MLPPHLQPFPPGGSGLWVSQISRDRSRGWGRGSGRTRARGLGLALASSSAKASQYCVPASPGVLVVDFSHKLEHLHLAGLQVGARAPLELVVHGSAVCGMRR